VRQGTRFVDGWEEGEAPRKLKQKLLEIQCEKEEIEKLKKHKGKGKSQKKPNLPIVPYDGFNSMSN